LHFVLAPRDAVNDRTLRAGRMLRTEVKVPILAVSLELYDDNTNTKNQVVKKVQWFDETSGVGKQVRFALA
jgi:hypothetical protein